MEWKWKLIPGNNSAHTTDGLVVIHIIVDSRSPYFFKKGACFSLSITAHPIHIN